MRIEGTVDEIVRQIGTEDYIITSAIKEQSTVEGLQCVFSQIGEFLGHTIVLKDCGNAVEHGNQLFEGGGPADVQQESVPFKAISGAVMGDQSAIVVLREIIKKRARATTPP